MVRDRPGRAVLSRHGRTRAREGYIAGRKPRAGGTLGVVIARKIRVHGLVQGVGYRWSMAGEARRLGVAGWVRNRSDDAVEAHLEGTQAAVDALVAWAHEGPRHARVTHVEVDIASPIGAVSFEIEP